jgi:hypothetical protein
MLTLPTLKCNSALEKIRGKVKTDPDCQFERGDIARKKRQLAVRAFGWGKNGQLEFGRPPERPWGED